MNPSNKKKSDQKLIWVFHGTLILIAIFLLFFVFRNTSNYISEEVNPKIKTLKKLVNFTPNYKWTESSLGVNYKTMNHEKLDFFIDIPSGWSFYTDSLGNKTNFSFHPKTSNPRVFNKNYFQIDILDVSMFKSMNSLEKLAAGSLQNVKGLYKSRGLKFSSQMMSSDIFHDFSALEFSSSWLSKNKRDRMYMRSFVLMEGDFKKSVTVRSYHQADLESSKLGNIFSSFRYKKPTSH